MRSRRLDTSPDFDWCGETSESPPAVVPLSRRIYAIMKLFCLVFLVFYVLLFLVAIVLSCDHQSLFTEAALSEKDITEEDRNAGGNPTSEEEDDDEGFIEEVCYVCFVISSTPSGAKRSLGRMVRLRQVHPQLQRLRQMDLDQGVHAGEQHRGLS